MAVTDSKQVLSVKIDGDSRRALNELCSRHQESAAATIRRALIIVNRLEEAEAGGKKIRLTGIDGSSERLIIV